jgi:hypothetical protein
MAKVLEGYMSDGVDLIHEWKSVKEALDSGRFDYLWDMFDEDEDENPDDLYECETIEELIEKVSYPFELIEE